MENIIEINRILKNGRRISFDYTVYGEWKKVFQKDMFFVEYNDDVADVADDICIIPLLGNILPIAWIYKAKIIVDEMNIDFYNSIPTVMEGYQNMYPMLSFENILEVKKVKKNNSLSVGNCLSFFSGGVDAYNTLVTNFEKKPTLVTVWGADISLDDIKGWNNISKYLEETSSKFGLTYKIIKSNFRSFIDNDVLNKKVKISGDGWWHGFQHGMGIITLAAPLAYLNGVSTILFASSFTKNDKGKVTCASDPTIDNCIRFNNTKVFHDGYEYTRQMKICNIIKFSKKFNYYPQLRVCWEASGGSNCCRCEKCWRTMLGIIAEKADPRVFGFNYMNEDLIKISKRWKYSTNKMLGPLRYGPIWDRMQANWDKDELPKELRWFYRTSRSKLGFHPIISFLIKLKKFFFSNWRRKCETKYNQNS